jgi:hypothetical protein
MSTLSCVPVLRLGCDFKWQEAIDIQSVQAVEVLLTSVRLESSEILVLMVLGVREGLVNLSAVIAIVIDITVVSNPVVRTCIFYTPCWAVSAL